MEKNISLSASQNRYFSLMNLMSAFVAIVNIPVAKLAEYYSQCLDRRINTRQTWLLLNAQAAFFMAVFPVSAPFMLRVVCAAWLIHALLLCKNNL